jgi:hypothetical protein
LPYDELTCGLKFEECGADAIFTNENFIYAAKRFLFAGASVRNLIISHQIICTRGWCAIASCGDFSALERNAHQRRQRESVTARHWCVAVREVRCCGKDEKEMMQFH